MNLAELVSLGYESTGNGRRDFFRRLSGHPNLLKRLTARQLMASCEPVKDKQLLDFGCGTMHFARALARRGAHVTAVDVVKQGEGFRQYEDGDTRFVLISPSPPLPFNDATFDIILVSGVVLYLSEPEKSMADLYRVLKPEGKLVLVHNLGRVQIRHAYENNNLIIRLTRRFLPSAPKTFADFERLLFEIEGAPDRKWLSQSRLEQIVRDGGFQIVMSETSFPGAGFALLYWIQYFKIVLFRDYSLKFGTFRYLALELLGSLFPYRDSSLVSIVGKKN